MMYDPKIVEPKKFAYHMTCATTTKNKCHCQIRYENINIYLY